MKRLLLDECLPKKLKEYFTSDKVSTVPEMGWAGKTNGELLRLAKSAFDVFITVDQNLSYQQNLQNAQIAIIVLKCRTSHLESILPLIPEIITTLSDINPGQVSFIE